MITATKTAAKIKYNPLKLLDTITLVGPSAPPIMPIDFESAEHPISPKKHTAAKAIADIVFILYLRFDMQM